MGRSLRGVSPPFTPSGNAAMLRSRSGEATSERPIVGGHTGLLFKWRADRRRILELLPPPLEPIDSSDQVLCLLDQTQGGLNIFEGEEGRAALVSVSPEHFNWNEALFYIQCRFGDLYGQYIPLIYEEVDKRV